jgi:hypothetical protein
MVDLEMFDYEVDSDEDLHTYGLGPCVGIAVGYNSRVSMLHSPQPDCGGAEQFFADLCSAIPLEARATVRPILAGALSTVLQKMPESLVRTRAWVESEMKQMGFGTPHVYWGSGGDLACHNMTTDIAKGVVEIMHHELLGRPRLVALVPLW